MSALSNYAVVIPSLHPVRDYLIPFLDELLRLALGVVIVADDGSGDEYQGTFAEADAETSQLTVEVRQPEVGNRTLWH